MSASFPLDEYLQRIGASAGGAITEARLAELQRANLFALPFENFDIQLGRGINLDPQHLIDKLLRNQRGGYCFELNGLFLSALRAEGFEARPLLARVHVSGEPSGRSHQLSLVTLSGRNWITDVGFGGACPRLPMPLEYHTEVAQDGQVFRLTEHPLGYLLQLQQENGQWLDLYSFDLTPVVANDIVYGNHFTSTHPASFFTTARIAVRWTPEGQQRLFNFSATTVKGSDEQTDTLADDDSYLLELKARFGIELDAPYSALQPLPPVS